MGPNSSILKIAVLLFVALVSLDTANAKQTSRLQTTNSVESAPLGLVNRSFARLEASLDDSLDPDRLSYRILHSSDASDEAIEATLKELLINIAGGPSEASLTDLEAIASEPRQIKLAIESFSHELAKVDDAEGSSYSALENVARAVKAALVREDLKLFSARTSEKNQESRYLIIHDEETQELLIMSLSN